MSQRVFVLTGEGIECEREVARYAKLLGREAIDVPLPAFFQGKWDFWQQAKRGDWVAIPGGFSFSDHFGAGLLLSSELRKANFFTRAVESGLHLLGVCNGFQMLVAAGVFGEGVQLLNNFDRKRNVAPGFQDRWVRLRDAQGNSYSLQARHGEGRLTRATEQWQPHVQPFLFYDDPDFDNGSLDNVAGLCARFPGGASAWGLMPHPETHLRPIDHPDCAPAEFLESAIPTLTAYTGDGIRLWKTLMETK